MSEPSTAGHDSFLDIVSNIVGILVILVMVVGLRVKNSPMPVGEDPKLHEKASLLKKAQARVLALRQEVVALEQDVKAIQRETAARRAERDRLAFLAKALEHDLDAARQQLDQNAQQRFDLDKQLRRAQEKLSEVRAQLAQAQAASDQPRIIENYPTPLSHVVEGEEIHFQLRGGRIAFIPLQSLIDELKREARQKAFQLRDQTELTDTVGPRGGFRLRYRLRRERITPEEALAGGWVRIRLEQWTLIPLSGELGEPTEEALREGSRFRSVLARHAPQRTTVTIWVYPDSFADFRRIKKELFHMGFATAARPLPHGVPISGSPYGTKSAAE